MSFILDALRKSEHERQRSAMPGIAQVPFGLPRRETPRWAIAAISVLAIAVFALAAAWWRTAARDSADESSREAAATSEIPLALPPTSPSAEVPPRYSAPPAPATAPAADPAEDSTAESAAPDARAPAPRAASSGAEAGANTNSANGADGPAPAPTRRAEVVTPEPTEPEPTEEPTLPSAEALAAEGITLPKLTLELHAYAAEPKNRFVFINGTKYVEGATLAEGPQLVRISPNGAVLSYLGRRFLLAAQ